MLHWPQDPSFHLRGQNGWSECRQFFNRAFFAREAKDVTCPVCKAAARPEKKTPTT